MEFASVGAEAFGVLIFGTVLWIAGPVALALLWKFKEKEHFTTTLIGAAVFFVFALLLEKILQNVLLFPTAMGLPEHAISRFVNARPLLWALLVGLFPGVFEETGRLVAFKTVLRKRQNRETAISYGLGHGGFEILLLYGLTYSEYVLYAVMINTGIWATLVQQVSAQAPKQADAYVTLAASLAGLRFADLGLALIERVFAMLFHLGASVLVFYAARDKRKFWLFPLAVLLHTGMDFVAGLYSEGTITLSVWQLEAIIGLFGVLTFAGAYLFLYRKDSFGKSIATPEHAAPQPEKESPLPQAEHTDSKKQETN